MNIDHEVFLREYWQVKPLLIRNALPDFVNALSGDELAGLALEEDVESRIVLETPQEKPFWHLRNGPFNEEDFANLPQTHWTLLVQGVDRIVPEVYHLLKHFDFIPQWRFDDVMISFAALHGSVGPHYDNYDVFLYQAQGRREWSLTTQNCTQDNYLQDLDLRIMKQFATEEKFILEEGDMLYLPPHVGHYGISLSEECMTYSFGYRSYQGQEVWDSLGDFLAEKNLFPQLYQDPDWSKLKHPSEITPPMWQKAQELLLKAINNEEVMKSWFACFATSLDRRAHEQMPEEILMDKNELRSLIQQNHELIRHPLCRFAYIKENNGFKFFINGQEHPCQDIDPKLLELIANERIISGHQLNPYVAHAPSLNFLLDLCCQQFLEF